VIRTVFIGGAGRSGTTLLGDLLGAHPAHICTPETSFKLELVRCGWDRPGGDLRAGLQRVRADPKFRDLGIAVPDLTRPSIAELMTAVVKRYAVATGKPDARVWIDHTPSNLAIGHVLLEQFPDARLIHLVRDGRAVAASVIPLDWGPNDVIAAAFDWIISVALGLALETRYPGRVLRITYEDLVRSPADVLQRACAFAELAYDPAMIRGGGLRVPTSTARQHALVGRPPDPSRIDAWRTQLSRRDIEVFESEVSSLLEQLGYEPMFGVRAVPPSRLAALAIGARSLAVDVAVNRPRLRRRKGSR
jgi:hypothetical protein